MGDFCEDGRGASIDLGLAGAFAARIEMEGAVEVAGGVNEVSGKVLPVCWGEIIELPRLAQGFEVSRDPLVECALVGRCFKQAIGAEVTKSPYLVRDIFRIRTRRLDADKPCGARISKWVGKRNAIGWLARLF